MRYENQTLIIVIPVAKDTELRVFALYKDIPKQMTSSNITLSHNESYISLNDEERRYLAGCLMNFYSRCHRYITDKTYEDGNKILENMNVFTH